MAINVTITKPGVTNQFGQSLTVGMTYSLPDDLGSSIVASDRGTYSDVTLIGAGDGQLNTIIGITSDQVNSPTSQMLANTEATYALNEVPYTRYRSTGTELVEITDSYTEFRGAAISALLVGDSISANSEVTISLTSPYTVNNNDGTMTVTRTSHGATPGSPFRVIATARSMSLMDGVVEKLIDANNFTARIQGRTSNVTSPTAGSVIFPLRRSARGWFTWLETLLGESFDTTWCAVGGATTATAVDLLDNTSGGPFDIGFVCIGMNDIYGDGKSLETMQSDMSELLSIVQKRCRNVCVLSVPPRDSGSTGWTSAKQDVHTGFNRWLYGYVRENKLIWVNCSTAVANGTTYLNSAAAEPDPAAVMSFDGVHPSSVGAYAIALAAKPLISPLMGVSGWRPVHITDLSADTGMVITDGTFPTDAAGVATGWTQSNTTTNAVVANSCVSRTVAADDDALGRNQVITFNYGTATGVAGTRFTKSSIQAAVTPGKTVQFRFPFSLEDCIGLVGIGLIIQGTRPNGTWQVYANSRDSNVDPHTDNISGVLQTVPAVVPSGMSALTVFVFLEIDSTQTTDVILTLWQPQFRQYE